MESQLRAVVKMTIDQLYEFIVSYHKQNQKLPEMDYIIRETGLTQKEVAFFLSELERKGKIYRNHSVRKLPPVDRIPRPAEKKPETVVKKYFDKIMILKIAIITIGIIAVIMDVYYNFFWFQAMIGGIKAFGLAVCLVGFGIISFEVMVIYIRQKKIMLPVFFGFLFSITLAVNIGNITAGQFNLFQKTKTQIESQNSDYYQLELLKKSEAQLEDQLELTQRRLTEYVETGVDNWKYYEAQKQLRSFNSQLEKVRSDMKAIIDSGRASIKQEDFFTYLSKLTGGNRELIQFIFQLLPALFLDLISSISFALALFLKEEKE